MWIIVWFHGRKGQFFRVYVIVYIVTFVLLLPLLCHDLGFSKYFIAPNAPYKRLEAENEERTKEAREILQHVKRTYLSQPTIEPTQTIEFSTVVITTRRTTNSHYLLQVAARLLPQITNDQGKSVVTILNNDPQPDLHEDAVFLSDFVPVVNNPTRGDAGYGIPGYDVLSREKDDYVTALETGLRHNSTYLIMIQDDAVPSRHLFTDLRFVLKHRLPWKFLKYRPDWAFLKLYYPEKWQGFGTPELPELLVIGLLGGLLASYMQSKISRVFIRKKRSFIRIFAVWSIYTTLVVYTVGRAHWIELRKLSPFMYSVGEAPGCCMPAVLYRRSHALELVKFLKSVNCGEEYPVDYALDDFANKGNLERFLLVPNLFSHIGLHSSLSTTPKDFEEFFLMFKP